MTRLLITEITIMQNGYCVIGLEHQGQVFRSIRPLPPRWHAWRRFPYKRGDILQFQFQSNVAPRPHIEDRQSSGILGKHTEVSECQLVGYLLRGEVTSDLKDLFGGTLRPNRQGGDAVWAPPHQATRSICGFSFENLGFRYRGGRIRISLASHSGAALRSLPLVDRDWGQFVRQAFSRLRGANRGQRLQSFLNGEPVQEILNCQYHFARIGIARVDERGCCWLMLDSLFPGPKKEWLEELR